MTGLGLIGINNRAAAHAIGALAFAGAARPAVMSQPLSRQRLSVITAGTNIRGVTFPVTRERLAGYRAAAVDAGFAWRDVIVAVCSRNDRAEAALLTTRLLTTLEPPDAIAAMSDEQAAGVLAAAGAAGLVVPTQLAVTGFDDAVVASELGLTTVAQSLRDQGIACAQYVIEDQPPGRRTPWAIIRRDSTRSYPQAGPQNEPETNRPPGGR